MDVLLKHNWLLFLKSIVEKILHWIATILAEMTHVHLNAMC